MTHAMLGVTETHHPPGPHPVPGETQAGRPGPDGVDPAGKTDVWKGHGEAVMGVPSQTILLHSGSCRAWKRGDRVTVDTPWGAKVEAPLRVPSKSSGRMPLCCRALASASLWLP